MSPRLISSKSRRSGFALVFAVVFLVLLMGALVIDGGLIYGRRAEIAKAVDSAALAGISNVSQGTGVASQLAQNMFLANYRTTTLDAQAPDVNINFEIDNNGNTSVNVRGTAYLRPLFLTILPDFTIFRVHASAQATRAQLVLSLALDKSGSMRWNNGWVGLPPAADTFVDFFDDDHDEMSLTLFSSTDPVVVPMKHQFKTLVHAAIPRTFADYDGYTFFGGGLEQAFLQNEAAVAGSPQSALKLIVIFTDGFANTFRQNLVCPPPGDFNLTSGDDDQQFLELLDPTSGAQIATTEASPGGPFNNCPEATSFQSIHGGTISTLGFNAALAVRQEAKDRALAKADEARRAGNLIYTIGLGTEVDQDFLLEIANDPASPNFKPSEPAGEFAYAPTAADLKTVFIAIARKILVRLSI